MANSTTNLPNQTALPALGEKISIIIPAYNEEAGISNTLNSLINEKKLLGAEIMVIDDGSSDKTSEILNRFPQIKFIKHPFNRGYGSAICTGARASKGEYIFWFDSDGQHRVEDLIAVCEKLIGEQLEYCIGVREETSYQDPNRKLGKWLIKQAVNFAVGKPVPDFNSGLRGFRRDILLRYLDLLPKGFGASTLTTLLMIEGDHYGATVPIVVNQRVGKSSVKQVRDGFRTLQIILHIVLLFKPLKFFGWIGIMFIALGGIYGILKAYQNGLGFPVLASLIVFLGVQSFFSGLICDQVSAMRRERYK